MGSAICPRKPEASRNNMYFAHILFGSRWNMNRHYVFRTHFYPGFHDPNSTKNIKKCRLSATSENYVRNTGKETQLRNMNMYEIQLYIIRKKLGQKPSELNVRMGCVSRIFVYYISRNGLDI